MTNSSELFHQLEALMGKDKAKTMVEERMARGGKVLRGVLIDLLTEVNVESKPGAAITGIYLGGHTLQSGPVECMWTGHNAVFLGGRFQQPQPMLSRIEVKGVTIRHLRNQDRTDYLMERNTTVTHRVAPLDDILAMTKDPSSAEDGEWILFRASLLESKIVGAGGALIDENGLHLNVKVRSGDVNMSMFINDWATVKSLFSSEDDRVMLQNMIERQAEDEIMQQLSYSGYNEALGMPGVELLVFGRLDIGEWTPPDGKKAFTTRRIRNVGDRFSGFVMSVDYLRESSHSPQASAEADANVPPAPPTPTPMTPEILKTYEVTASPPALSAPSSVTVKVEVDASVEPEKPVNPFSNVPSDMNDEAIFEIIKEGPITIAEIVQKSGLARSVAVRAVGIMLNKRKTITYDEASERFSVA